MKLFLDTTDNLLTMVKVGDNDFVKRYDKPQDQDIVGAISEALRLSGANWEDIDQIEVNPGPGSFTGVRVGVSVANAIAFARGILINGVKPPISPVYSSEPHITTSKKNL